MNIYRFETGFLVSGGSATVLTHKVRGGLLRQIWLRAESSTSIFRATIMDIASNQIINYGFHQGEINDTGSPGGLPLPVLGTYIIRIESSSLVTVCSANFTVEE